MCQGKYVGKDVYLAVCLWEILSKNPLHSCYKNVELKGREFYPDHHKL